MEVVRGCFAYQEVDTISLKFRKLKYNIAKTTDLKLIVAKRLDPTPLVSDGQAKKNIIMT